MANHEKQSIIVRVEVEIPGMALAALASHAAKKAQERDTSISVPVPTGSGTAKVRVSNNVGYICAKGTSTNEAGDPAIAVFARIYPDGTPPTDATPPTGTQGTRPDGTGNWAFDGDGLDVKGASYSAGGTAQFLRTWAYYANGEIIAKNQNFTGKTSTTGTDCNPGSSSGGSSFKFPREWRVLGEGFAGEASAFNTASLLRMRADPTGQHVWTNGGDGKNAPAIELRHAVRDGIWELDFRHLAVEIRYTCPSASWHPLNANTLEIYGHKAGAGDAPHSLTITPV